MGESFIRAMTTFMMANRTLAIVRIAIVGGGYTGAARRDLIAPQIGRVLPGLLADCASIRHG
jgi:hypothetical protein